MKWLDAQEAADVLGIGMSTLYNLARNGKLPAKKVGRQWRFNREVLERWLEAQEGAGSVFEAVPVSIQDNPNLREPQLEAYERITDYLRSGHQHAIAVLPVGCGKTGLMSLIPFGVAAKRVLAIAPNLTIRDELAEALDITNRRDCFWYKTNVLKPEEALAGPYRCILEGENTNIHDCNESHFVITNIQQIVSSSDRWLSQFPPDYFDLVLIDEAHHSAAASWKRVLDHFPEAKVVSVTATPFRSDQAELPGEIVYRYPFATAMARGYIKRLTSVYITPSEAELYFTLTGETRRYSLGQILELKEDEWFSRGVAASEECNVAIVDASTRHLEDIRAWGTQHQIIAAACSVEHAESIASYYRERGYEAAEIHSYMPPDQQQSVVRNLKSGALDCIVHVGKLGEGFDHPKLSVAAIFRPFRTLSPYIQFIGRAMRVVVQNHPGHWDNRGLVVSHIGLNVDELFDDFRDLDTADRRLFEELIRGEREESEAENSDQDRGARTRLRPEVVVLDEVIDSFLEQDFLDPADEALLDDLRQSLESIGLSADDTEATLARIRAQVRERTRVVQAVAPGPVQPRARRQELRHRLQSRVKSSAASFVNRLGLAPSGTDLGRQMPLAAGKPNVVAAMMVLNSYLNRDAGVGSNQRHQLSTTQLEEIHGLLDDKIEDYFRSFAVAVGRSEDGADEASTD